MAYDENGDWIDEEQVPVEEEQVSDQEKRKLELLKYQAEPAPQPLQAYAQAPLPPTARVSPNLVEKVKKLEGYTPSTEWDVKQHSVGYGTRAQSPNEVISEPEAQKRLQSELDKAASTVDRVNPNLPAGARDAMISLTYNTGQKWVNDNLGDAVRAGDTNAIKEILVQYNKAGGQVNQGLQNRRNTEVRWIDQLQSTANQLNNARGANEVRNQADLYAYLAKDKNASHIEGMTPALHNRLAALIAAAPPEIRSKITINSGYRSPERQAELFKAAVAKYGSPEAARHNVAPPGRSQHGFGNATDLGFGNDQVRKWVHANAGTYGLRFPLGHEPWHIEVSEARGGNAPTGGGTIPMNLEGGNAAIPSGVSHTEGFPPDEPTPTEGEQAVVNATNPTLFSTMQTHQYMNQPQSPELTPLPVVTPPPSTEPEPTFMEKLGNMAQWLSPMRDETGRTSPLGQVVEAIDRNVKEFGQGGASGIQDMPVQMIGSPAAAITAGIGALSGSDDLSRQALQGAADLEQNTRDTQTRMGMNPDELTPAQYWGHQVGSNLGLGVAKTLVNTGLGYVASKVIGPAAQRLGETHPFPNINPISSAAAADPSDAVFGKQPLVVMTPAGPQAMNAADAQQLAWGGVLMLGFGSSIPLVAKTVRMVRSAKPFGLSDVFDPRRPVSGATGTEAASLPIDRLKMGSLDIWKGAMDAVERQAKYDKGVQVGIDPLAANAVLQHLRVQTNSGAQALIGSALKNGEMNATPDLQFKVQKSIGHLAEWSRTNPDAQFPEYIRLKVIQEELRQGVAASRGLPATSPRMWQPPQGGPPLPYTSFPDRRRGANTIWNPVNIAREIRNLETATPEITRAYQYYRENLAATRDFISTHPSNAIENPQALRDTAVARPSMPIFSANKKVHALFDRFIDGKDNPLRIAEQEMTKALDMQLRFDAEQVFMNMADQNVGRNAAGTSKAFTPRKADWVAGPDSSTAKKEGALLTRKRNGIPEYWTADPVVLHAFNSGTVPLGIWDQFHTSAKSTFQKTTTGFFAPWFAMTGGIRAMEQGWTTAPGGIRTAAGKAVYPSGPIASAIGVGKQVGPRMMRPTAKFFRETLAQSAWGKALTLGQADLLGRSFEKWYMDSYYRRLEVAGAFGHNPVMEGNEVTQSVVNARRTYGNSRLMNPVIDWMDKAIQGTKFLLWNVPKKLFYVPGNALLTSIQEAPAFEMARKTLKGSTATNRPTQAIDPRNVIDQLTGRKRSTVQRRELSDAEVASMIYKNYTGNPSTRGYRTDKAGKPIPFDTGEGPSPRYQSMPRGRQERQDALRATWKYQNLAVDAANFGVAGGRTITPWSGVLLQSPAATLAAMRDNPVRANMAFAMSAVMPEVVAYLWNSYWSNVPIPVKDENGNPVLDTQGRPRYIKYDYVNHSINGRNDYNVFNNVYFAHPNSPPWEGVEFRHFQETAFQRYMTRMFMHQYAGKAYGTVGEDVRRGLNGFLGTAVIPPLPPVLGAFLASKDLVATGGFAGTVFKSRYNQYMDLGGGESTTELMFRGIIPAITDTWNQAMQAGTSAPDWWSGVKAAGSQVAHRIAGRTAILGDITGDARSQGGSTILSEVLWDRRKEIDDLSRRFRYDESDGINIKRGSNAGRKEAEDYLGDLPPTIGKNMIAHPGLPQKPPTNPLYTLLMREIETTFNKDEPKKGGIAFKAMWGQYGIWGQLYNEMRPINKGNDGPWVASQLSRPEDMQWFRERNINPLNQDAVRNYYQYRRNLVSQKIMQTIIAVEQKLSKRPEVMQLTGGKPFKINMLDPHKPGIQLPDEQGESE